MKVADIMTRNVQTCSLVDSMNRAAQIMWDGDCGCVPVIDDDAHVVGMVTDRDICMAAYTQGRPLWDMTVASAAAKNVVTIRETDSLHRAEQLMREARVRRLPVVDADDRLVGLLSLADMARRDTAHELKTEVKKSVALLQTLRDEVRVKLHLGGLDFKDQWRKLELHIEELEKKADAGSRSALADAVKRLEAFKASLADHH